MISNFFKTVFVLHRRKPNQSLKNCGKPYVSKPDHCLTFITRKEHRSRARPRRYLILNHDLLPRLGETKLMKIYLVPFLLADSSNESSVAKIHKKADNQYSASSVTQNWKKAHKYSAGGKASPTEALRQEQWLQACCRKD